MLLLHHLIREAVSQVVTTVINQDYAGDHDLFSVKYTGYRHNSCNLQAKKTNLVPLYFCNESK